MSESEYDATIGRLVRQHGATRKRMTELTRRLGLLSQLLSGLSQAIALDPMGGLQNRANVDVILHEIGEDFSPALLRGLIAEYYEVKGALQAERDQLRSYGIE